MQLVENLKNSNIELREQNQKLKLNEFQQRGSSSSDFSEAYLKKRESEIEERYRLEMEEFRKKLEKETQEILLTKGITRDRMRELEEDIKEELRTQHQHNSTLSPKSLKSKSISEVSPSVKLLREHSKASGNNLSVLEQKLEIRNEVRKKEKLLEIKSKQKLAQFKKKAREELEEEFKQKAEELKISIQDERLELSRQKSSINVTKRKLIDQKRELEDQIENERTKYRSVIDGLKKKLESSLEDRDFEIQEMRA